MTVPKTIRLSKSQIDLIVDKIAIRIMQLREATKPDPDPVPCKRCSNLSDPEVGYCNNCMEDLAEMNEWLQRFAHCDICDEPLKLRDAAEIAATCQICLCDPKHKIDLSILDRVD